MRIEATFVKSAAGATDFPRDHAEIALVGRSNVGKSSLINALVGQSVARTSAAPGKTRLANIYRVARRASGLLYLVDLPGYGYARGGAGSAREFEELTRAYFAERSPEGSRYKVEARGEHGARGSQDVARGFSRAISALLLIDSRHPGLRSDLEAWRWLTGAVDASALVATKIDKLARGERIRALRELQSVFGDPVLPVSAATGEGLDELWKLIDTLANNPNPTRPRNHRCREEPAAPSLPKKPLPPRK